MRQAAIRLFLLNSSLCACVSVRLFLPDRNVVFLECADQTAVIMLFPGAYILKKGRSLAFADKTSRFFQRGSVEAWKSGRFVADGGRNIFHGASGIEK
jgi:hypothetical protein